MRVLTSEAMAAVDRRAIEEIGIPGAVLMENAALGVVEAIAEQFDEVRTVAVLCGPGNNGGDGYAIARHLSARGYSTDLWALDLGSASEACAEQARICVNLGIEVGKLGAETDGAELADLLGAMDLVVDALFGTGLGRPLEGWLAELVEQINRSSSPVLAVDLPSGLNGSTSSLIGPHVEAETTVTFGAPKVAHIFAPATDAVGEVVVASLGFPEWLIDEAEGDLRLVDPLELALLLEPRGVNSHKGTWGHALVVAGSDGKSGAAVLAVRGAMRSGAGLVTAAVPRGIAEVLEIASIESMTLSLPESSSGGLDRVALEGILEAAQGKHVVALGPGLGSDPGAVEVVRAIVADVPCPVVLDADGINAFEGQIDLLRDCGAPLILTPHPAELARLLGTSVAAVESDRPSAVREAVRRTEAVVVLKGHRTLIADSHGIAVNMSGNPGMGSGGTGDVLTGVLAGLIAQGLEVSAAAELGVHLHGRAGDIAAGELGERALTASDLLDGLPEAIEELAQP